MKSPQGKWDKKKKERNETKLSKLWKRGRKQYQDTYYTRNKYKQKKMEWFNKKMEKIERMSIMDKANVHKRIKELRCAHQWLA